MSPSPPTAADRPLRRDAERNRRLILDAAREAFADEGLQVTLDAIAARAGVGVGTVYRRFPDKESLIDALFEERIAEVVTLAEQALAKEDAWAGFVCWFEGLAAMQAADRGLKEVLITRAHGRDRVSSARERLLPMVTEIVARAQAAGELRADLSPNCVSPDVWRRYAVIVLDGLRVRRERPTELPGRPLRIEEVDTIMRAKGT
jgi:AcrR family transcriptional regulator